MDHNIVNLVGKSVFGARSGTGRSQLRRSVSSSCLLASSPPAKPVREWSDPMTRWQGMMMLMPLAPMACATALAPWGLLRLRAMSWLGARLAVWYLAQRPPYLLLKRCADRVCLEVESLANASKILVKLPLGALQDFRRSLGQRCIHVPYESAPVALGAWTLAPVAKAQFVANGRQGDFPARSAIVLKMYGLSHSFLLKT